MKNKQMVVASLIFATTLGLAGCANYDKQIEELEHRGFTNVTLSSDHSVAGEKLELYYVTYEGCRLMVGRTNSKGVLRYILDLTIDGKVTPIVEPSVTLLDSIQELQYCRDAERLPEPDSSNE